MKELGKWETRSAWIGQEFVDKLEGAFGTRLYLPGGGLARNSSVQLTSQMISSSSYLFVVVRVTEFERLDEVIVGKG